MRRLVLGIILVGTVFLFSCEGDARKVENLVYVYNKVLVDAYQRPNAQLMENFVTERELVRIDSYISYLAKNNRIFKGSLEEISFAGHSISGDEAQVITRERWVYSYIEPRTRKPVSKTYDAYFSNVYHLIKVDGRWVVDDVESEEIGGEGELSEGEGALDFLPAGPGDAERQMDK